jgi:hypothetical protein
MQRLRDWLTFSAPVILAIVALALAAALTAKPQRLFALAAQVQSSHKPSKSRPAAPLAPQEMTMPFRVSEKLYYRIAWSAFSNAAMLELSVPERRDLFGWRTWHFQAAFHTIRTVRTLFAIDDQFDSYTDTSSLECRQFEMYLNELGKSESDVLHLIPTGQHARAPGAATVVLPGTRDPLGMLLTLRAADWQRTPELRVPVYDGHDLYEMRAHLEAASDPVQTDAGSFTASRIAIAVFQNGKQDPAIQFTIWLANDAARTPVQVVATLPFGNLRVELTSANPAGAASP